MKNYKDLKSYQSYHSYQSYQSYQRLKKFQKTHPHIQVGLPRQKRFRTPPPCMNKKHWKTKTEKMIYKMNLVFFQQVEDSHYTYWKQFRAHIRKLFNNLTMGVNVMLLSEKDLVQ